MRRELSVKPSCLSDIHGVPGAKSGQLWEKIDHLVDDPLPDGKLKKKIKAKKDLYRLRVGDYRVFYTFGEGWVRLLGVRKRDERTFDDRIAGMEADRPRTVPDGEDVDIDAIGASRRSPVEFRLEAEDPSTPLPRPLTGEWLTELRIPAAYVPVLASCRTEEALLAAQVPGDVLGRVLDNLFPKAIQDVEQQPDLVVPEPADLVKYREGSLVAFLLKLDEGQRELTDWALSGPTMVRGGAGTGKSTVALYRVKALLERPRSRGDERVLFTTYTRALIGASQQLLGQLLQPDQLARVRVATCDEIAREIVAAGRTVGQLESGRRAIETLRAARAGFVPAGPTAFDRKLRARALDAISDRYLVEEFDWIIDGRGLATLEEYKSAPRPGRGYALSGGLREAVWEFYEVYRTACRERGTERWPDLRTEALAAVRSGRWSDRYDYVVVDEAQDLTPTALALMAELAVSPAGLFFAADAKQSLYSRNYTWTSAHPRLQFKGRTRTLKRNYRSTAEIERAAFDVLAPEAGEVLEPSQAVHSGPMPVLLTGVPIAQEGAWAARFLRQISRHLRLKLSAGAVLVPSQQVGERLAAGVSAGGVPARFFAGRDLDLTADVVKVLTLHSAKGLEFPFLVVCGFEPGTYPTRDTVPDAEVYAERMRNERRLLYVAMSRAMRGLMVVRNAECGHEALLGLDSKNWHVEEVA